jgi:hypothetical protein
MLIDKYSNTFHVVSNERKTSCSRKAWLAHATVIYYND